MVSLVYCIFQSVSIAKGNIQHLNLVSTFFPLISWDFFHLDNNPQPEACLYVVYMFFVYFHFHTVYHPTVLHTSLLGPLKKSF